MHGSQPSITLTNLSAWALVLVLVAGGSGFIALSNTNFDPVAVPDGKTPFDPDNLDHLDYRGHSWYLYVDKDRMSCSGYGCVYYQENIKDIHDPDPEETGCGACDGKVTTLSL